MRRGFDHPIYLRKSEVIVSHFNRLFDSTADEIFRTATNLEIKICRDDEGNVAATWELSGQSGDYKRVMGWDDEDEKVTGEKEQVDLSLLGKLVERFHRAERSGDL
jgi:hypothetical protein